MKELKRQERVRLWGLAVGILLLVGGCAQGPTHAEVSIVSAVATSQTSVAVTFSGAVDDSAVLAENYDISGPGGSALDVLAAYPASDGRTVNLATAPQQLVKYQLSVKNLGLGGAASGGVIEAQGGFAGSAENAPIVASAIALSNTQVLITFADPNSTKLQPMGDGATNQEYFEISSPNLEVLGAAYASNGSDLSRVILTTGSMTDVAYTVKVTNVLSQNGSKLVDPFLNTAPFHGMTADDATAPTVLEVIPTTNTTIVVRFSEPVSPGAANPSLYVVTDLDGAPLPVVTALLNDVRTEVTLTTWPMTQGIEYVVRITGVIDANGNPIVPNQTNFVGAPLNPEDDVTSPRVMGANSTSNTNVVVTFSEPVLGGLAGAEDPKKYTIVDRSLVDAIGPQAIVRVQAAVLSANKRSVTLTTLSQSEMVYALTVTDVSDLVGNQIAPPDRDHPFQTTFFGTGPVGQTNDGDGDGLSDGAEQAGWTVTVQLANGQVTQTKVTSSPDEADTDGDGVSDLDEKSYLINPRSGDTDGDQLSDYWELNYVYSEPTVQDSDDDTLIDGLEWWFFRTSPNQADTDGDQIDDPDEIDLGNRNPRLADLPRPGIVVGDVDLQLDVRFSAQSQRGTRELESTSVSSTLTQTNRRATSNVDSNTQEFTVKAGVELGFKVSLTDAEVNGKASVETGYTGQWSSSFTQESSRETQDAHARSQETQAELQLGESLSREVQGASMRLSVNLRSLGDIAFTIANLQVTAFLQDERSPGRLLPIATLVPESEPAGGYNLGPISPERGPLIFVAQQIFPSLVEQLMRDPTGLVFKIANYDITDELGRNFAFTSQDVNDRTATIVIDYGAADSDGDGEGDLTERLKVSTSAGRPLEDIDDDGDVDQDDRVLYDSRGRQVGITLAEALEAVLGLVHYDEADVPTSTLDAAELENSFSTVEVGDIDVLWRVRGVSMELSNPLKEWFVLTSDGIAAHDQDVGSRVLPTGQGITLAFVQDLDDDGIPARMEYSLGCSDDEVDTDGDGLTDFREAYEGWTVSVIGRGDYSGYSSCAREDSDGDGLSDVVEEGAGTDAKSPDTDRDGLTDYLEITGYSVNLRFGTPLTGVMTNALDPDHDGDTLPDGAEVQLGTDPTVDDGDKVFDDDGDGLVNFQEDTLGWDVTSYAVSTEAHVQGAASTTQDVKSSKDAADTDGDGLDDFDEFILKTNATEADTDGDGLLDGVEVLAGTDPRDADTDDDIRDDDDELNTPLTINVEGEDAYQVVTDPLKSDVDNDGLVDGQEVTTGTDPLKADTDDDGGGLNDKEEGETCVGASCRDPLAADQKLQVTFTLNVDLDGDLDPAGGTGDFSHVLTIQHGATPLVRDSQVFYNNNTNAIFHTASFIRPFSESLSIDIVVWESDSVAEEGETCRLDDHKDLAGMPRAVDAGDNYTSAEAHDFAGDLIAECKYTVSVTFDAD